MISCQVSLYPLGADDYADIVNEVLERLKYHQVEYKIGTMSTVLCGKEEDVWSAVQDMFHTARQIHQQSILTVTFSDCCGCSKVD
ncbi:MAG: YkoF family thiamine/hydroxymethylpyrimidine-binding protein [Bacillota bacterium]